MFLSYITGYSILDPEGGGMEKKYGRTVRDNNKTLQGGSNEKNMKGVGQKYEGGGPPVVVWDPPPPPPIFFQSLPPHYFEWKSPNQCL